MHNNNEFPDIFSIIISVWGSIAHYSYKLIENNEKPKFMGFFLNTVICLFAAIIAWVVCVYYGINGYLMYFIIGMSSYSGFTLLKLLSVFFINRVKNITNEKS